MEQINPKRGKRVECNYCTRVEKGRMEELPTNRDNKCTMYADGEGNDRYMDRG